MRRTLIAVAVSLSALASSVGGAGMARADTALVTATVSNALGIRSIQSVPAVPLSTTAGTAKVEGDMTAVVLETVAAGKNWSLTADLTDFTLPSNGGTILADNAAVSARALSKTIAGTG